MMTTIAKFSMFENHDSIATTSCLDLNDSKYCFKFTTPFYLWGNGVGFCWNADCEQNLDLDDSNYCFKFTTPCYLCGNGVGYCWSLWCFLGGGGDDNNNDNDNELDPMYENWPISLLFCIPAFSIEISCPEEGKLDNRKPLVSLGGQNTALFTDGEQTRTIGVSEDITGAASFWGKHSGITGNYNESTGKYNDSENTLRPVIMQALPVIMQESLKAGDYDPTGNNNVRVVGKHTPHTSHQPLSH
eukprot:jgi/Psemu1/22967/gm1.22967_g